MNTPTASPTILLINTGKTGVTSLRASLPKAKLHSVYSRNLVMHITETGEVNLVNRNVVLPPIFSHVFIRRRGKDEELCGIIAEHYTHHGVAVSDPINLAFKNAESKLAQMSRLANAGLRVPETIIMRHESYLANRDYIHSELQFPLVYKENGSRGEHVHVVTAESELLARLEKLALGSICILQTLIPNDFDTRTLVAYGQVLGSIKRTAKPGMFHNNFSKGGTVEAYTLTAAEVAIAIEAVGVCGVDFGGVDFIHTPTGPIILEVNKSPQVNGFETIHGGGHVFSTIANIWQKRFLS